MTDKGVNQSGALSHVTNVLNCECPIVIDDIPPEPEIGIIEQRLAQLKQHKVDGIIAVGGGSAIDSAKVLAATFDYSGNIADLFGENLVAGRTLPLANKTSLDMANQVVDAIEALCRNVEIPATLRDFDISEDAIPLLAEEASKVTRLLRNNPRKLSKQDIAQIYKEAF
ncbi:iron-containing alcohol dehydrogenase [Alteromonas stellipolaris]|uniref:iron-containing alcohol dehydrogenase n=1 Tax=Alteromonas stellipolaris TaxID=233316 RepID=UPI001E5C80C5|nr:iron-containing alcohol dehydrogenase [Alteromonas stellipolaris]